MEEQLRSGRLGLGIDFTDLYYLEISIDFFYFLNISDFQFLVAEFKSAST